MNGQTGGSVSESGKNNEGIWESHPTILAAGDTNGMNQWTPGHRGYQALIATPLVSCLNCHLREFFTLLL